MKGLQNIKIYYINEILKKYSDKDHSIKCKDIMNFLEKDYSLKSERKSINKNIKTLKEKTDRIIKGDKRDTYYYSHKFNIVEAKIICDLINACEFLKKEEKVRMVSRFLELFSIYEKKSIINSICHISDGLRAFDGTIGKMKSFFKASEANKLIKIVFNDKREIITKTVKAYIDRTEIKIVTSNGMYLLKDIREIKPFTE